MSEKKTITMESKYGVGDTAYLVANNYQDSIRVKVVGVNARISTFTYDLEFLEDYDTFLPGYTVENIQSYHLFDSLVDIEPYRM